MSSALEKNGAGTGFFSRIQGKLILLLLILLVPTLLLQAYDLYDRFQKRYAQELQASVEVARVISKAFESFLSDIVHQELAIGLSLAHLTVEEQNEILDKNSAASPAAAEFAWADRSGKILAAKNRELIGENIGDQVYFQALIAGRDWTVSDLLLSKRQGPMFAVCRAVRDAGGEVQGVVFAGLMPDRLHTILGIDRSRGGGIALFDRRGLLVFRYPFVTMTWQDRGWLLGYPEFTRALHGEEVSMSINTPYERGRRLVALVPVDNIGWTAGAGRSEDTLTDAIFTTLLPQTVLFLVVVLSAFGAALVFAQSISLSFARLRRHALAIGRGKIGEFAEDIKLAELRDLTAAFNRMAADIRFREEERTLAAQELRRSRDELEYRVQERTLELREYVQRLKLATEVAAMGVWEWDIRTHKAIWDDRMFEIFGAPRTEPVTEASIAAMVHPEDRIETGRKLRRDIIRKGNSLYEFRIIRPSDGEVRHLLAAAGAVFNEKGKVSKIVGVNFDITERKRVEDELRQIPSRLIAAQEEERKRLACELHDSIGQTLAALKFRIEHIRLILMKSDVEEALRLVEQFIPYLQHSIEETRSIYMGLRPKMLEDFGVIATLHWYRDELLKFYPNRHIELDIPGEQHDIPQELTIPIFRIVQEALNNISKHSRSEWVDISLKNSNGTVELVVSDDGVGMDVEYIYNSATARSLGLTGMQERTELTGGEFFIESSPGKGTTIRAVWPARAVDLQRKC